MAQNIETYGAPFTKGSHQAIYELLWFAKGGSENLSKAAAL
jgi:hypothetical protein